MKVHDTIASLRAALAAERRVVFVPTMGNLHDGHIALTTLGRAPGDCLVASIFVNRLQFGPSEDFDRYPRTFRDDCDRLAAAGVRHLFAPPEPEFYPSPQRYFVEPAPEHQTILEGEFRPGHFRGVATVVLKLFGAVQPHVAVFGKKDYQQLMVIRNMVREFVLPIEIVAGETVRAQDGLALSSRNGYLTAAERAEAPRLYRALSHVRHEVRAGSLDFAGLEREAMEDLAGHGWAAEYVAVRKRADLQSPGPQDSELVVLGAAKLGATRLIDNLEI